MQYTDAILQNLRDAGCDEKLIRDYRNIADRPLAEATACGQQAMLLAGYRKELLDQLHEDQKRIDCLDHLLYQLRAGCKGR
jgi:hypothetical protein